MENKFMVYIYNTYFEIIIPRNDIEVFNRLNGFAAVLKTNCRAVSKVFNPYTKKLVFDSSNLYIEEVYDTHVRYIFPLPNLPYFCRMVRDEMNIPLTDFVGYCKDVPLAYMSCKLKTKFKPRDYQEVCLKILADRCDEGKTFTLIDLPTGMGKSLIGAFSVFHAKYRTAIVVLPKYVEKWIEDVMKYTTASVEDFYVVRGSQSLITLIEEIRAGKSYDFIIFSLRTLYNFHKDGLEICKKEDLFNTLGIGTLLTDESHQETAALLRTCMLSNVKQVIGMSATFLSNDQGEVRIQELLFPQNCRISNLAKREPYIEFVNVMYTLDRRFRVRYKSQHGYSHILFEQSLTSNIETRLKYFTIILDCVLDDYIKRRKKGDKCLIFMSTVSGCTRLVQFLENKLEKYKLTIKRYTQEDDYSNVMESDICCSTLQSAGVAIDIPNLIQVVQTVTIGSPKANIQAIGRLRKLDKKETKYYKLVCPQINRQYVLHKESSKLYNHIVSKRIDRRHPLVISPYKTPKPLINETF